MFNWPNESSSCNGIVNNEGIPCSCRLARFLISVKQLLLGWRDSSQKINFVLEFITDFTALKLSKSTNLACQPYCLKEFLN